SRSGQVKLYAPPDLAPASSISHFSDAVSPDQIMAPSANDSDVLHGLGLSVCVLRDIGWQLHSSVRCPDHGPIPSFDSADNRFADRHSTEYSGTGSGGG